MKHIALLLLCTVAVAFAAAPTEVKTKKSALTKIQEPMLWEISGNGLEKPSWLFGTIHIGDPRITGGNTNKGISTSKLVNQAFQKADKVFVERDVSDPKIANEGMKLSMLPSGKTIADVVSKETVSLVKKTIQHIVKQSPMLVTNPNGTEILYLQFSTIKPTILAITLELTSVMITFSPEYLDMRICNRAKKNGKKVLSLETPQQLVASLEVLTPDEQQKFLVAVCETIMNGKNEKFYSELINTYICGDIKKIDALMDEGKKWYAKLIDLKIIDKLYDSILYKRNDRMVKKIKTSLVANPDSSFFVAVGAAHMIGKTGLVSQLKQAGYTVKRVTAK